MPEFTPCKGATSDHAWRSITVEFIDSSNQVTPKLQGATWNMQMWCTSQADAAQRMQKKGFNVQHAHSNNPMDISEEPKEYYSRKTKQIKELEAIIQAGNDFIFLQEPDWIDKTNGNPSLFAQYKAMLSRHGWDLMTTPTDNKYQSLVTLYNTKRLKSDSNCPPVGHFIGQQSGKYRGYQTNFIDIQTNKPIALINLHLEFGKDYRQEMLVLQKQLVSQDIPCIMGGDTNNVQNIQLENMIGNWHAATNIRGQKKPDGTLELSTIHCQRSSGKPIQKAYDGFFVNPGLNSSTRITETGGMYFSDLGNGTVEYKDYIPDPKHTVHLSLPGEPWQRLQSLKKRLEIEKQNAQGEQLKNIQLKLSLIEKMSSTCSFQEMTMQTKQETPQQLGGELPPPKPQQTSDCQLDSRANTMVCIKTIEQILENYRKSAPVTSSLKAEAAARKLNAQLDRHLSVLTKTTDTGLPIVLRTFKTNCTKDITAALAHLDDDLTWTSVLLNLIKRIANVVIHAVTLGNKNGFFALEHSTRRNEAEHLNAAILNMPG